MMSRNNVQSLRIDNVISSQLELGPIIADRRYGWILLLASLFFQSLIPSLLAGFGIFMLFLRLETSASPNPTLWDNQLNYVPLFFVATWTILDPWCRTVITNSMWPRLIAISGVCLTCAGVLCMWIGVNSNRSLLFLLAGILSGLGASLIITQSEILLSQYFRLKMVPINILLQTARSTGFILIPILLGNHIIEIGIMKVMMWYQSIILQGLVICMTFKKPSYLKSKRRRYKLIEGISDDEEDIFAKSTTELQNTMQSTIVSNDPYSSKEHPTSCENDLENNAPQKNSITDLNKIQSENATDEDGWHQFSEDGLEGNRVQKTETQIHLHTSFAREFNNDLKRIDNFKETLTNIPAPLFSEIHVNNNTTYSYDIIETSIERDDPVVFMPIQTNASSLQEDINFLKQPTFYKSLLFLITTKFSLYAFWTFFPTYLYYRLDSLKIHHTTALVGCVGVGGLVFMAFSIWINVNSKRRALFLCWFCWIGAAGYFMLTTVADESYMIFSAIQITLSINALQNLGEPLLKITLRGETNSAHMIISTFTGLSFIIFLIIDISYVSCFQLMALLQFLSGCMWFGNFMYKRIKYDAETRSVSTIT